MSDQSTAELLRLRAMVAELAGINEIVAAVSGRLAIQQITEILIDKTLRYLQASQGALFLLADSGMSHDELTAVVRTKPDGDQDLPSHLTTFVRRISGPDQELPLHLNKNLAAWVLKNKRLLVVNTPGADTPLDGVDLPALGIRSLLAAPLRVGTRIIGILAAFNKYDASGFTKQDERFLGILGTQCSQSLEAARLYEEEKHLELLRQELQTARGIQQRFLPRPGGAIDERTICGFNLPATEVGGDFYETHALPDGRIFVSVGDVCGKGMPAALLMSNVVAIQRTHLNMGALFTLQRLVENINAVLCQFTSPGQFVCGVFAVYDPVNRVLELINAGHPPPMIFRGTTPVEIQGESGMLLGIFPEVSYCAQTVDLPGDSVVCLYTDGITEARDRSDAFFGEERLCQLLESARGASAFDICRRLQEELEDYRDGAPQSDDITAVVIRVGPAATG